MEYKKIKISLLIISVVLIMIGYLLSCGSKGGGNTVPTSTAGASTSVRNFNNLSGFARSITKI